MKYFDTLPKIINTDYLGTSTVATNLLARADIIPEVLKNPLLYYQYDIQDGDTPEIVAAKYYSDAYRYWLVLYANNMLDPQWSWPLTYRQFVDFLDSKYGQAANTANQSVLVYTTTTTYGYEKKVTTSDNDTGTVSVNTYIIDAAEYANTATSNATYSFPGGVTSTVGVTKREITIYDYEEELNEAKRKINLIDVKYASKIEDELQRLMR